MPISKLRIANRDDIPELIRRAFELHRNSGYRTVKFDIDKTKQTIERALVEGLVLIGETGALIALVIEPHFSKDKMAAEILWTADTARERSDLYAAFAYWARNIVKAQHITTSTLEDSKYFVRKGYNKTETTYVVSL